MTDEAIRREQLEYYRSRAAEYDEWFLRMGRYDRGEELNARWHDQVAQVRRALDDFRPAGDVLELACGTGLWTQRLAEHADRVTAVDAAAEMLAIARRRLGTRKVDYVQTDLFSWRPQRRFDVVFFAFWLSHVPPGRFEAFWEMVGDALAAGGRVFLVDSLYTANSTAVDHRLEGPQAATVTRRLNDGREFRIVKVFHDPERLSQRLRQLGWEIAVHSTRDYFLYAHGRRGGATGP